MNLLEKLGSYKPGEDEIKKAESFMTEDPEKENETKNEKEDRHERNCEANELKKASDKREKIYNARESLKKEGLEVDLYDMFEAGNFFGLVGKINGHIIILKKTGGKDPNEYEGVIDGKEIDNRTISDFLQYRLKNAAVRAGSDLQPPKDLQVAALEYALKKEEKNLEIMRQTEEVLGADGLNFYKRLNESLKNGVKSLSARVEESRKIIEDFKNSESGDGFEFVAKQWKDNK